MKLQMRTLLSVSLAAALAGCSLAPTYERPDAPVDAAYPTGPAYKADGSQAAQGMSTADIGWRDFFGDPLLQQLIDLSLANNRDLRVAVLNIEKARAQYRIQRADLLPSVQATTSANASRTSAASSSSGRSAVGRTVAAEVGFSSWELDLFGRIRSLEDQALQTFLATEQTQRSTRMSLVAEVAGDWLAVNAAQERLALARQTLESQRETLRLTERKHALGVASGVDLSQVRSSVESARVDVASYTTALAQARHALDLVVGAPVDDALLPASTDTGGPASAIALAPLPAPLPSSVLLQRPDVLSAEHTLQAANADIGAARAAFFPTLSLTASTGRSSDALSSLFAAGTRTWSFIPSLSIPIFDAGSLRAELDASKIEKDIAVADYEHAIQTAFGEVADALSARAQIDEQLDAQRARVEATGLGYTLADARYRGGVDSYLEALDAQRSLYSARQTLITLRLDEAVNRVTLYKVLGGGADAQAAGGPNLAATAQGDRAAR